MKKHCVYIIPAVILSIIMLSCNSENSSGTVPFNPLVIPDSSNDTWTPGPGYSLVWSDEFDGPEIDTGVWSYETYATGWRHEWNHEWQDYVDNGTGGENAYIEDGILIMKASMKSDQHAIHAYDSVRMVTKGVKSWQYGKIAARMALPFGKGVWPAFWMLGDNGNWPASGEIDILELIGGGNNDNVAHAALHWANASDSHASVGSETTVDNLREFHVFELEWDEEKIRIGVDGNYYFERSITSDEMSEFHQPFYILLNLAIGGDWPGYPDNQTAFPQYLFVDWVRVYQ